MLDAYNDQPNIAIISIGDIIDRGKFIDGLKCLELLFNAKLQYKNVFILQTNHFTHAHHPFHPSEFWNHLNKLERKTFTDLFDLLPYAVMTANGIIGCHGLPVHNLSTADNFKIGSSEWYTLVWGRITDTMATPTYIKSVLQSNGKSVIIRSHDHYSRLKSHNNRVLTFTTSGKLPRTKRLIAEVDLKKEVTSIDDVKIIDLDKEL